MQNTGLLIKQLNTSVVSSNGVPTAGLVKSIYDAYQPQAKRYYDDWTWYLGFGDPVFNRKLPDEKKIQLQLNHAFPTRIVNQKAGYCYGQPQQVSLKNSYYPDDKKHKELEDHLLRWREINGLSDLDYETGKVSAAVGICYRLLSLDDAKPVVRILYPWECCTLTTSADKSTPEWAMRWWTVNTTSNKKEVRIRLYNATHFWEYSMKSEHSANSTTGSTTLEPAMENGEIHGFDSCPVIGYANNRECMSDWERAKPKIKAYSNAVSDLASELAQIRLGYMVGENIDLMDENGNENGVIDKFKQTGMLLVNSKDPARPSRVYFLEKNLNDAVIENHLNRLKEDILQDSMAVDFTDEKFGSNLSGVAIRFKLTQLENKSIIAEEKHKQADRQMMRIVCAYWQRIKSSINIDYLSIQTKWTRNLPANISEQVENVAKAKGVVSDLTAYSLAPSVIDNPADEVVRVEDEQGVTVDLGQLPDLASKEK